MLDGLGHGALIVCSALVQLYANQLTETETWKPSLADRQTMYKEICITLSISTASRLDVTRARE